MTLLCTPYMHVLYCTCVYQCLLALHLQVLIRGAMNFTGYYKGQDKTDEVSLGTYRFADVDCHLLEHHSRASYLVLLPSS